jgi:Putative beta-barrel porin-2, OmpL-like. bbp2
MRSWLMLSAVGFGWAASASAVEPVSPSIRRAEAILSTPAEQLDIRLISCTGDTPCDAGCGVGGAGGVRGIGGVCGVCGGMSSDCECESDCESGCGLFGGCCLLGGGGCGLLSGEQGEAFDLGTDLFGEDTGWDVGGWLQAGYTDASDGVLNTRPDSVNVHQAWLFIEKIADGSEGLDWGARVDVMYGLDGENTQAYGNDPGEWDFDNGFDHGSFHSAIPQAYGVLAYDKLSVKFGHFYTPAGYEVVPAAGNFFYSHAFTWNFTEPFTHTGAIASYEVSDQLTSHVGWVAGWDTGYDQFNDSSAFIGGATLKATDDVTLAYIVTMGNLGKIGDGVSYHGVATVALTDKLNYALAGDTVRTNTGVFGGSTFTSISIVNYLTYSLTDKVGVGGRAEWFKVDGVSYNEVTAGVNIKPTGNLTIRPEVRHQWSPGAHKGVNNPIGLATTDDTILGVDAILSF